MISFVEKILPGLKSHTLVAFLMYVEFLKVVTSERFSSSMDQPQRTEKVSVVLKKRLNWI